MKKILYIAFHFPPLGGVASIRAVKHVKYLARLGYQVEVLSASPFLVRYPRDLGLIGDIPSRARVWRCFFPDPNWLFKILYGLKLSLVVRYLRQRVFIPDPEKLWLPFARRKLKKLLAASPNISLAVITSGPPSALSLGLFLKQRYKLPFICDFRDEWTNNAQLINLHNSERVRTIEMAMEEKVLRDSSGIVYLTIYMQANFLNSYPWLRDKPNALIPNGYDEEDYQKINCSVNTQQLRIVYTGSFYDRIQPDRLWKTLCHLMNCGKIDPACISLDVVGKNRTAFVLGSYADDTRIRSIVRFHGFQPHQDCIRRIGYADALLVYVPSGKNSESTLTGKLPEYLRSGKPILAIIPSQGIAAEAIQRAGIGFIADFDDEVAIRDQLLKLYRMWKTKELKQIVPDIKYIETFSRERLTSSLAKLIEDVSG
jgi:glycosyltransferase involved in cell wall biosynthesis